MWGTALAVVAGVLAVAAWVTARRTARRATQLQDMYWQLKYAHGELKARVDALAPEESAAAAPAPARTQFVPLSQVKR